MVHDGETICPRAQHGSGKPDLYMPESDRGECAPLPGGGALDTHKPLRSVRGSGELGVYADGRDTTQLYGAGSYRSS